MPIELIIMIGQPTTYLDQTQNIGFNMAVEYTGQVYVVPTSRVTNINFENRITDISFEDRTIYIGREG